MHRFARIRATPTDRPNHPPRTTDSALMHARPTIAVVAAMLAAASFLAERAAAESPQTVRIALASIRRGDNVKAGVEKIKAVLAECREKKVQIVCFPEVYLPGLRGSEDKLLPPDQPAMEQALADVRKSCRENQVAAIVGMEWGVPGGLENRAYVIAADGRVLGHQTKNQITPGGEAENYVPGSARRMFDIGGVKAGIVICHEGWRYPETVRWAAVRGAQIVFQPQVTGSDGPATATPKVPAAETSKGPATGTTKPWGQSFYEMAMQCRAQENTVYFASVNRAMTAQNSATSLIDPAGNLMKFVPRGEESLLVADLDLTKATGFYAKRYLPKTYEEDTSSESQR